MTIQLDDRVAHALSDLVKSKVVELAKARDEIQKKIKEWEDMCAALAGTAAPEPTPAKPAPAQIAPERLEDTHRLETESRVAEFTQKPIKVPIKVSIFQSIQNTTKSVVSTMDLEELHGKAKCCACSMPLNLSPNANVVCLDKKAEWKNPIWDNIMLKPGFERIPRAIAVMCDTCIEGKREATEVIEVEGSEIRYHKVSDLQDAFEITPDMVAGNIKDLRGQ